MVACLSQVRFKSMLLENVDALQPQCSQQMTKAYLDVQRVEAQANKALFHKCRTDIKSLQCYGNGMTSEDVVECLRKNKELIADRDCKAMIFGVQEAEMMDNQLDVNLVRACHDELETLCAKAPQERKLKCLRKHRKSPDMSSQCLEVVQQRMRESAHDIRLQPGLLQACRDDVKEHCPNENQQLTSNAANQQELEGTVLACLRRVITERTFGQVKNRKMVSQNCINEVHRVILESEYDPQLDVPFYKACKSSIESLCSKTLVGGGNHDTVTECIKAAYYSHHLTDALCRKEVCRL